MLANENDACAEFARNAGREDTQSAWMLTPWDTWERNPFYTGPKVRHPESDDDGECKPDMENPHLVEDWDIPY